MATALIGLALLVGIVLLSCATSGGPSGWIYFESLAASAATRRGPAPAWPSVSTAAPRYGLPALG